AVMPGLSTSSGATLFIGLPSPGTSTSIKMSKKLLAGKSTAGLPLLEFETTIPLLAGVPGCAARPAFPSTPAPLDKSKEWIFVKTISDPGAGAYPVGITVISLAFTTPLGGLPTGRPALYAPDPTVVVALRSICVVGS